jgi:hypothetical protein
MHCRLIDIRRLCIVQAYHTLLTLFPFLIGRALNGMVKNPSDLESVSETKGSPNTSSNTAMTNGVPVLRIC